MHKETKWAKQLLSLQEEDGKWGFFHSLSSSYGSPTTTEQALRRLKNLGYSIEDRCIQKAVAYMERCLTGQCTIPDRREKLHDWDIFTSLMLAAWIREFTDDCIPANQVSDQWRSIVSCAFLNGRYDHDRYAKAYADCFHLKPRGGRLVDFVNFYQISLVSSGLSEETELALMDHVLQHETGIYYIYDRKIAVLPSTFASRDASRYLSAIELLSKYKAGKAKLDFVVDWLLKQREQNGMWDMGSTAKDGVYFPLSDHWRKAEFRQADCTERIERLIKKINDR